MALTKVTGGTISTTSNYEVGVITATKFVGPFEGAVTGNADTATEATNITVTANNSTDETVYPIFVDGATGAQGAESDTGLTYNPSTGNLTADQFIGNISGTGATFTTVDISGTLNYTHVTDVYSVGVGTFQNNVQVGAGISVVGVSTFTNGVGIADSIFHTGDTDTKLDFGTDTINLTAGGTTGLSVLSSSVRVPTNLGINGASPQSPLDVIANTSGYAVDIRGRSTDDTSEIHFCGNNSSPNYAVIGITTTGGGQVNVEVAGSQRVAITSAGDIQVDTGKVLIGTTIEGHVSADNLTIADSGNGGITIRTGGTSNGAIFFSDHTTGTDEYDGFVQYNHGPDPYMLFGTSGDERLRIRGDGNINAQKSLAVGGITTSSGYDLSTIDKDISDTAVDIFVYDTRKDSDGGAWRNRTSRTSWYNETLNTSTRGARKEFPAVAVIVMESTQCTIYDADDPNLPMWMIFNFGSGSSLASKTMFYAGGKTVFALNGMICFGGDSSWKDGVTQVKLIEDTSFWRNDSYVALWTGGIGNRNVAGGYGSFITAPNELIVAAQVDDIAMTVLPNAPINDSTGLPIPTIALATDGGVSVIRDNGNVVDMTVNGETDVTKYIAFTKSNKLAFVHPGNWLYFYEIPTSDLNTTYWNGLTGFIGRFTDTQRDWDTNGKGIPINVGANGLTDFLEDRAIGHTNGVDLIDINEGGLLGSGMHCGISTDFNTGWMHGDIKGVFLSSIDDTNVTGEKIDLTNGSAVAGNWSSISANSIVAGTTGALGRYDTGTDGSVLVVGRQYLATLTISNYSGSGNLGVSGGAGFDTNFRYSANGTYTTYITYDSGEVQLFYRSTNTATIGLTLKEADIDHSENNKGLAIHGTITKSAVATGAELVSYDSLTSSNYLEQPYNSDLNFGTGDFCMMGWFYNVGTSASILYRLHDSTSAGIGYIVATSSGGELGYSSYTQGFSSSGRITHYTSDTWNGQQLWNMFVCGKKDGNGFMYVNGVLKETSANANSHTDTTNNPPLRIGNNHAGSGGIGGGKLALIRISSSFPSEEQIKKIYDDEKCLFHKNAKCTLYGTSDAVTGLAFDDTTDVLHVGTSSGRSEFQGLSRINNTTTAVTTAISASNELVAEQ